MSRAQARRVAAAIGVGAATLAVFGLVAAQPAPASPGTVTINPNTNVTPSSTVTVSGTGIGPGGTFDGRVVLSQCGNAMSNGTPLTSSNFSSSDCDGVGQIGHLVGIITPVTVTNGQLQDTSFPIRESGIGANNDQCIPVTSSSMLACSIAIGDIATQGTTVAVTGVMIPTR